MNKQQPAHLFKRIIALFIDLAILYILGLLISLVFESLILKLGNFKVVIGIIISTLYFTLLHSEIGKGQTLGKKVFDFKVVKTSGEYLSVPEALLRSAIFTIPYCFSDLLSINSENSIGFFDFCRYTIIPGALFINHFFIFLNPLRQCYYDSLLDSIVTGESGSNLSFSIQQQYLKFFPTIGIILIVIIGLIRLSPFSEENRKDLDQLSEIRSSLTEERYLHFSKFYYTYPKNDPYEKTLKIDCYITENEDISSEIYLITEELHPFKTKFNIKKITLSVVRDFNLGIYNSWEVLKKNEKSMKSDL